MSEVKYQTRERGGTGRRREEEIEEKEEVVGVREVERKEESKENGKALPRKRGSTAGDMESTSAIDLDRSRSIGEILRSALRLYGEYPWLFWTLAVAVMAPWDLAKLAITGAGPFGHVRHEAFLERESITLFGATLTVALISVLHVKAVVVIGEGRRPRLGSVALHGVRVLPVAGAAAVIADIGTELGFFALLVPGIVLWIGWIVVAQVAAIEQEGVRAALRRSWQLTRGRGWHVLGLVLAVGVPTGAVSIAASQLTTGSGTSAGAVALGIVVNTLFTSFGALTTALLYFDLRVGPQETRAVPAVVQWLSNGDAPR